jgi:hypothetical protein
MRVWMRRAAAVALAVAAVAVGAGSAWGAAARTPAVPACGTAYRPGDWPMFGRTPDRSNAAPAGLTLAHLLHLHRLRITLPDVADGSPILMTGVMTHGGRHDLIVVSTRYGIALGIDARTGHVWWRYTPAGLMTWNNTSQLQVSGPVADPDRLHVYVTTPDGYVRKLVLGTGAEVRNGAWPARLTRSPTTEKFAPDPVIAGCNVVMGTSSFFDVPPYVGHLVVVRRTTGRAVHVFNVLCSDRHVLIDPATCVRNGSDDWGGSPWSHGSPSVDPVTGDLVFSTGNGTFDGRTDWGDSVLETTPDASRLVQSYAPINQAYLNAADLDLGSGSVGILPVLGRWRLGIQAGKDGMVRLLNLANLNGTGRAGPQLGGEVAHTGISGRVYSQPAIVATRSGATAIVSSANEVVAFGMRLVHGHPRIARLWAHPPPAPRARSWRAPSCTRTTQAAAESTCTRWRPVTGLRGSLWNRGTGRARSSARAR